nr:hypothetical protein [Dehalococcoidales bacterium]
QARPLVPIAAEGEPASAPRLPTVHQGDTAVKLPVGLPMAGENPAPSVAPQPLIPALLLLGAGLA